MAVQGKKTLLLWKNSVPSFKLFDSVKVGIGSVVADF